LGYPENDRKRNPREWRLKGIIWGKILAYFGKKTDIHAYFCGESEKRRYLPGLFGSRQCVILENDNTESGSGKKQFLNS
jgi:hypothetical protein